MTKNAVAANPPGHFDWIHKSVGGAERTEIVVAGLIAMEQVEPVVVVVAVVVETAGEIVVADVVVAERCAAKCLTMRYHYYWRLELPFA